MIKILKIAYEYAVWLEENGAGSTFSTFIDDFGYQEKGAAFMYDNVMAVMHLAKNSEIPVEGIIKMFREQLNKRQP